MHPSLFSALHTQELFVRLAYSRLAAYASFAEIQRVFGQRGTEKRKASIMPFDVSLKFV